MSMVDEVVFLFDKVKLKKYEVGGLMSVVWIFSKTNSGALSQRCISFFQLMNELMNQACKIHDIPAVLLRSSSLRTWYQELQDYCTSTMNQIK